MSEQVEFWVWNEGGDLPSGPHTERADAERERDKARAECAEVCGTDGEESTPGRGDFACGVLREHGIFIQITRDGQDVTSQDYGQWG